MVPAEVIRLSGLADETIAVDRVEMRDGPRLRSLGMVLRLVREMRQKPLDLVIDLHSLSETNILAFLTKARSRLLANRENRSLDRLSNFRPSPPKEEKDKHLTDRYLDVLRPLGIIDAKREFCVKAKDDDARHVEKQFFDNIERPTVGLFPGAGHPSRCWPLEKFADIAVRVDHEGKRPAVFLGPEERAIRDQVSTLFPASAVVIDGLSISQFIAAAERLDAFVTNDTGPMHLAAIAGSPIVLLLDERAPSTYIPLTHRLEIVCDGPIEQISVDAVHEALTDLTSVAHNDNSLST